MRAPSSDAERDAIRVALQHAVDIESGVGATDTATDTAMIPMRDVDVNDVVVFASGPARTAAADAAGADDDGNDVPGKTRQQTLAQASSGASLLLHVAASLLRVARSASNEARWSDIADRFNGGADSPVRTARVVSHATRSFMALAYALGAYDGGVDLCKVSASGTALKFEGVTADVQKRGRIATVLQTLEGVDARVVDREVLEAHPSLFELLLVVACDVAPPRAVLLLELHTMQGSVARALLVNRGVSMAVATTDRVSRATSFPWVLTWVVCKQRAYVLRRGSALAGERVGGKRERSASASTTAV